MRGTSSWKWIVCVSLLSWAAGAAAQAPAIMPVQGYLTDASGTPVDGDTELTVRLYDGETSTTMLHEETQTVTVDEGSFSFYIGDGAALSLALFRDYAEVWVGVTIDAGTELPRFQLGSVPYAGFAQYAGTAGDAETLGGTAATGFQSRVTGTCGSGQAVASIGADGTVSCVPVGAPGDIEGVTAGEGLGGGGTTGTVTLAVDYTEVQARVSATCPAGEAIRAIAATGAVTCQPVGDITGVSAGSGLTGGGTSGDVALAIGANAVTAAHIGANAVGSSELAPGAVQSSHIVADAVGMREIGSLPAGNWAGSATLILGDNFLMAPAFSPPANGQCFVAATTHVRTTTGTSYRSTYVRTARQVGAAAPTYDPDVSPYVFDTGQTNTPGVDTQYVWPVTGGTSHRFGCALRGVGGDFVDKLAWCRVSWICF